MADNSSELDIFQNFSVSSDFLKDVLLKIKSEYDIVPITELLKKHKDGQKEGLVSITFDDGFIDCYKNAFHILKALKAPAAIYLNSAFIDNQRVPVEYLLAKCLRDFTGEVQIDLKNENRTFLIRDDATRTKAITRLILTLLRLKKDEIDRATEQICSITNYVHHPDASNDLFLSWEMAAEMLISGLIEFGNHGLNHLSLGALSEQEIQKEILDSHNRIKAKLNISPIGFSFPYGQKVDYNEIAIKILRDNGYAYSLTAENSSMALNQFSFNLPRISIREEEGLFGFKTRKNVIFSGIQRLLGKND